MRNANIWCICTGVVSYFVEITELIDYFLNSWGGREKALAAKAAQQGQEAGQQEAATQ